MKHRTRLLILAALGAVVVATAGAQVFPVRLDQQETGAEATDPSLVLSDGYIQFRDDSVQVTASRADPRCFSDTHRFVDCRNGTVTDGVTGLIWLGDRNCAPAAEDWKTANETVSAFSAWSCHDLTDGSRPGDWRLPTEEEWWELVAPTCSGIASIKLVGNGSPKVGCFRASPWADGVVSGQYWSSSGSPNDGSQALIMNTSTGSVFPNFKHNSAEIWPVRSGGWPDQRTAQPALPVSIALALPDAVLKYPDASTQRTAPQVDPPCYDSTHRFADCGNGTVTDSRTGLVWLADLTCLDTIENFADANQSASTFSETHCTSLTDGSQPGDWRLPTEEEWRDIFDPDCPSDPEIVGNGSTVVGCFSDQPWATGVGPTEFYWSSTTFFAPVDEARVASMASGTLARLPKHDSVFLWPVRGYGGQDYNY